MANTKYANAVEAEASLRANGFRFTKSEGGVRKTADAPLDEELFYSAYSQIAAFLCNDLLFQNNLTAVSAKIWEHYRRLTPMTPNKFTRAMGLVAAQYGFRYHDNVRNDTSERGLPIAVRLIGGDGFLGQLLRSSLFWKDSMDARHGEHTHSLQWLTIANGLLGTVAEIPRLYSYTSDYRAPSQNDKPGKASLLLWQWLADCFPTDLNGYATEKFTNDETLESQSYRSPQVISDYLFGKNPKTDQPLPEHFVSNYLFHRYKNRGWLQTKEEFNIASRVKDTVITDWYTGSIQTHAKDTAADHRWGTVPTNPARLVRNPIAEIDKIRDGKPQPINSFFHGKPGKLWFGS
ncbi:hypothetical protein [Pseudomonas frederiksbergensis]|jgi:hypothetical protein|uniref:hypothetical protein n=1 Tax=Pseudomonas TaxID=286 RepID=UPI0032E46935